MDGSVEMKYERMYKGRFLERPNRFIAHIEIEGKTEIVHVKNTGRCRELLVPNATVYVQKAANPERKTQWDLIGVEKVTESGIRMVNMDSQVTNYVVKEWIEQGNLFTNLEAIKSEVTFGNSRVDLYVEADGRKIFIEVKGVTLEKNNIVQFPDAPSERAVKHVEELAAAVKAGYEAYVFFVIQMKGVKYFTPNIETHRALGEALWNAKKAGVQVIAYDCNVDADEITIESQVPVILGKPALYEMRDSLTDWYVRNKRDLPWRKNKNAYHIWVSEIMLQQTRVEAVKPFYHRFIQSLPTVKDLAIIEEEKLLKLWEGLGYYNRVRNMQLAARQIVDLYQGDFPESYEQIAELKGIGSYTAGAISSISFGIPKPAVDGNVLRVMARVLADDGDIMKAAVRKRIEEYIEEIIPPEQASDFNQGLIELGAVICVPNGKPKCDICPLEPWCEAKKRELIDSLPVKSKQKERKVEERTVFIFKDGEKIAIRKRPKKGLLAGLYELPNALGHWSREEVISYSKSIGLMPIKVESCGIAKHVFSHIEWRMNGYEIRVDELEKNCKGEFLFVKPDEIQSEYPMPAAFEGFTRYLDIKLGQEAYRK